MSFRSGALLVIDVQNDFLPGGALAVAEGDRIIAPVNDLLDRPFDRIIASRDWHPTHHVSFQEQGGRWPVHCVAGSKGADFPSTLKQGRINYILHKGLSPDRDSYSAFRDNDHHLDTGLAGLLKSCGIDHVTICGLALDFCVAASALDARAYGFNTRIILPACRAVDPDDLTCMENLKDKGVILTSDLSI